MAGSGEKRIATIDAVASSGNTMQTEVVAGRQRHPVSQNAHIASKHQDRQQRQFQEADPFKRGRLACHKPFLLVFNGTADHQHARLFLRDGQLPWSVSRT